MLSRESFLFLFFFSLAPARVFVASFQRLKHYSEPGNIFAVRGTTTPRGRRADRGGFYDNYYEKEWRIEKQWEKGSKADVARSLNPANRTAPLHPLAGCLIKIGKSSDSIAPESNKRCNYICGARRFYHSTSERRLSPFEPAGFHIFTSLYSGLISVVPLT